MAGFIRRFPYFPSVEELQAIEGVNIVDLPPPGAVQGLGTGVVAIVGEFPDVTRAVKVDGSGNVTTLIRPVETFSSQDLLNKVGGFDPTLGDFGGAGGNAFAAIRGLRFARLVCVPINLASDRAARLYRQLPTNDSPTSPVPVIALVGATVPAGSEFSDGSGNVVRTAGRVVFTDDGAFLTGVNGAVPTGVSAYVQTLNVSGAKFLSVQRVDGTYGVKAGDILVLGVIGDAGDNGTLAGTYRVVAVASNTSLTFEQLDGEGFASPSDLASLAFRIHPARAADSGGQVVASSAAGCTVPVRLLGCASGTTIGVAAEIPPVVPAVTPTATAWEPLSGLTLRTHATGATTYVAALQGKNATTGAELETAYNNALDALLVDDPPAREVNLVGCARLDATIRGLLKAHVLTASSQGTGREALFAPEVSQTDLSTVLGDAAPGVGAQRHERDVYSWPGFLKFVPEAVGTPIKGADGRLYDNGMIDSTADMLGLSLLSVLPPERNPGQQADPVPAMMSVVKDFSRGITPMGINEYKQLKAKGVMALRNDRNAGFIFQSGVTTSLVSGQKNINRRRMADYIQDSIAQSLDPLCKLPMTEGLKRDIEGSCHAFCEELLSRNNAAAQRISAYEVDIASGNTPDLEAKGIFVVIVRVRTVATADAIVLQAEVSENTVIVKQQ